MRRAGGAHGGRSQHRRGRARRAARCAAGSGVPAARAVAAPDTPTHGGGRRAATPRPRCRGAAPARAAGRRAERRARGVGGVDVAGARRCLLVRHRVDHDQLGLVVHRRTLLLEHLLDHGPERLTGRRRRRALRAVVALGEESLGEAASAVPSNKASFPRCDMCCVVRWLKLERCVAFSGVRRVCPLRFCVLVLFEKEDQSATSLCT